MALDADAKRTYSLVPAVRSKRCVTPEKLAG